MSEYTEADNDTATMIKVLHWAEMATVAANAHRPLVSGFGTVVTMENIIVSYPDGDCTDEGETITYQEHEFFYDENTTAAQIYEFVIDCAEEARVHERKMSIYHN